MPFLPWTAAQAGSFGGVFGDASDGAVTLDGVATVPWASLAASVYTMTRDCFCSSLTINGGVTLKLPGMRVYVDGALINNGTISSNGNPAAGATGGGASGQFTLSQGQAGATGVTGAGVAGTAATGNGGAGGTGGTAGANTGGAGGAVTQNAQASSTYHLPAVMAVAMYGSNSGARQIQGGGGGGSGGGDGVNAGGGGGGGAGITVVSAVSITNAGAITATGGAGAAGVAGNAAGGGGGGGGTVVTYSSTAVTGAGTITAAGGALGSGVGTGGNGTAGSPGTVLNVIVH